MSEHEKNYQVYVNGNEKAVHADELSYEAVVELAFPGHDPETIYSVTFDHAAEPKQGELIAGQSVKIHKGEGGTHTEFDVEDTGRS